MKRAEIDMVEVAKMLDKMVEENDANQIIGAAKMLSLFGWSVRCENGGWIFKPTKLKEARNDGIEVQGRSESSV